MRIEFLQAGTGDSIWISHNKNNIVLDGGKTVAAILDRYKQMPKDENIDLLVVTHIDSDHIAGVIALVDYIQAQGETERLKQIWFNYPKKEKNGEYSVMEGNTLSDSLCKVEGLKWCNNTSELIGKRIDVDAIRISILAPDHDVAEEFKPKKPDELGVRRDDWNAELKSLIEYVDDEDLDEDGPNSQSIVALLEFDGKKILLPGDCTPKELYKALHTYNGVYGTPLELDLMKLPHHGSKRNITRSIFSEIECKKFVISTNVNRRYCFPHKEAIAKIICYRNKLDERDEIYFNYRESLNILGITEEEQNNYNIKLEVCNEFNF